MNCVKVPFSIHSETNAGKLSISVKPSNRNMLGWSKLDQTRNSRESDFMVHKIYEEDLDGV